MVCGVGWCMCSSSFFMYLSKLFFCSNINPAKSFFFTQIETISLVKISRKMVSLYWKHLPPFHPFLILYGHCINNTLHGGLLLLHRWCKVAASEIYSWNSLMMPPHQRQTWRGNNMNWTAHIEYGYCFFIHWNTLLWVFNIVSSWLICKSKIIT